MRWLYLLAVLATWSLAQPVQVKREVWLRESAKTEGLQIFMQQRVRPLGDLAAALRALPRGWTYQREGMALLVAVVAGEYLVSMVWLR